MDRPSQPISTLLAPDGSPVGVVHVAAEYGWLARTGGLAEAVAGLATNQARSGIPVAAVIPLHRSVRSAATGLERMGGPFTVQVGPRTEEGRLYRIPAGPGEPRVYCIEHPYFDRNGLYGESGGDYADNLQRYAFFCRAALEILHDLVHRADEDVRTLEDLGSTELGPTARQVFRRRVTMVRPLHPLH